MVSEDFLRIMNMMYAEGWKIIDGGAKCSQEQGWETKVVLQRDGETREISSSAPDVGMLVWDIKEVADSWGRVKLEKIQDTERYYEDIDFLTDEKGEKLRAAVKAVVSGSFQFTFDPFEGIRKILQDRIPVNDTDVRGVKEHYHESLAHIFVFGREMASRYEKLKETNPKGAPYAASYESILRQAFMPPGTRMEPVTGYRKFLDACGIDVANLGTRIIEQQKYTSFLMDLVIARGRVDVENGVRAVLDVYWRMCELAYPLLNIARISAEMAQGRSPKAESESFEKLVQFLKEHQDGSVLVEFVEPVLRNAEAHVSTSVITEDHNPIVIAYDARVRPAREIARMPFSAVDEKAQALKHARVLEVMCLTLMLFELAFQITAVPSREFKLLLVRLGQL
jgi:hypothetical protein